MHRKNIALWSVSLTLLVWLLYSTVLIIQANLFTFRQLLYITRSSISISNLFLWILVRHSLFIVAFMFGMAFLAIHYATFAGRDDFLRCAVLMFTAAGFAETSWDTNVLFNVQNHLRLFWLHTHDSMLLLFSAALLVLMLPWYTVQAPLKRRLMLVYLGAVLLSVTAIWLLPPVRASMAILPCAALFALLALTLFVLQARNNFSLRGCLKIFLLLPPCVLMALRTFFLFQITSPSRNFYIHYSPILMVVYCALVSLGTLIRQQSTLFFQRSQNRRFEEVMNIKTSVTNLLTGYCMPPTRQISALTMMALDSRNGELTQTQRHILHNLQNEVNRLTRQLRNIREFETLPSTLPTLQMQRIRLGMAFNYVQAELSEPVVVLDDPEQWRELYALGEPYSLIRANVLYCSAAATIRCDHRIHIRCQPDGNYIQVKLSLSFDAESLRDAQRICRIINRGSIFCGIEQQSDMALYIAHSIFSRHSSPPKAEILHRANRYTLQCCYFIQRTEAPDDDDSAAPLNMVKGGDPENQKLVVLLSTSSEEIDLICSYLVYEPYRVLVATSEKTLLRELDNLKNLSTLIIGSTFMDSSIYEICWMIRERYSLGQLPILLVQRDPDLKTHLAAQKLANSVTTALSDRFEFCQKVHTLVELQASVQSTVMSRLAFLQSQMNPHFIFNTMNTIMAMCLNEPMQAYELLGYFSQYLRSSLFSRDLDKTYPVYQEIDLINAYLTIEKARFKELIDYRVDTNVPESWQILPMLVEPLVENSIKHGLHANRKLTIRVQLHAADRALSILVEDDGAGFEPEKLARISSESTPSNRFIGLENVRTRLKLFYNETLNIQSALGKGTKVSFTLHNLE